MAGPPFADIWKVEEVKRSRALTAALAKALSAPGFLRQVDQATSEPANRPQPPAEVAKLFDKVVADAVKKESRAYKGMGIKTSLQYRADKGKWRATGSATVAYFKKKIGAKTHTVKPGETLFKIAKAHYGDGVYFPVIAEANPKKVKLGGDFIVAHSQIKLPAMEVLDKAADTDWIARTTRGDLSKIGGHSAREIEHPWINFDLTGAKETKITANTGSCVVEIFVKLKGTIAGKKDGPIKLKFDEKGHKMEMQKILGKRLVIKAEMDKMKPEAAFSTELTGPLGSAGIKITPDMKAKAVINGKLFTRKIEGYTFEGKIGAEISFRFLCVPSDLPPGVQQSWKAHEVYGEVLQRAVVGTGVIVVGGGAILLSGGTAGAGAVAYGTAATAGGVGAL
ncbi:LysM peptidoglycan-binding domain-containing protein [Frigidibacter sp. ROC022]|uniref:LysM peptidoglycan-binding domain-containing protein n=1 Tax=Frigidibacter sp. ROC022 TaxID=2971796 RepID=UPI00215AD17A|nr:LysM domain-containing protein [Frigidibacter sp. ROC022]MCR8726335.1 LysM peptidoglycan-binding domain-containing protein [Frigidibacter sp. ROC022]